MSTQVSERPTGGQPTLPAETNPYPANTAMVPLFGQAPIAVDVPSSAAVVPPVEPKFTPLRRPGATLAARPVPVPASGRVTNLALLARVRDGLQPRDAAEPSPADERARYTLAEIVYAAALHAEPPYGPYCPDCKNSDSGWCAGCLDAGEKSEALYRLHGLILAADTYAAAAVLVARSALSPTVVYAEGRR